MPHVALTLALATYLGLTQPGRAVAQQSLAVDTRLGVAVPVGGFAEDLVPESELRPSGSFGVQFSLPRGARRAWFAGFSQHRLSCEGAGCAGIGAFESTAWKVGTRVSVLSGARTPWVRLAVVLDRSEADFLEDGVPVRLASDLALGVDAGVGFSLPVARRVALSPGVRYEALNANFPGARRVKIRYVVADLGFILTFF